MVFWPTEVICQLTLLANILGLFPSMAAPLYMAFLYSALVQTAWIFLELLDAGKWTGNIVALPNNRVRVTHPAWFETGEGAPDFRPSQHIHYSKSDLDYTLDVNQVFDNLYAEGDDNGDEQQQEL